MKSVRIIVVILLSLAICCVGQAFAATYKSVGYGVYIDMDSVKSHWGEYRAVVKVKPDYATKREVYSQTGKRLDSLLYLYAFKKREPELKAISLTMLFKDGSTKFFKIGDPWEKCIGPGYTWWKSIMAHEGKI